MSSKVYLFMFTHLFLFKLCLSEKTTVNTRATSGPFTVIPNKVRECEKPTIPYFKEPMMNLYMDVKDTVLTGNLTVHKAIRNSQTYLQNLFYEDGRWQVIFHVNKLTCRTSLVYLFLKSFGIVYDKKTCSVGKGTYNFKVDYNKLDHIWTNTREYGRMMRRVETYNKTGTFACYEMETEIKPDKPELRT